MADASWSIPSTRWTGGRCEARHACAAGREPGRETAALLVLSGRARRAWRTDDSGIRDAWSARIDQQLLLAHCRDCVLALAALHPSPLASSDFISRRALVTDRLLHLWRHGQGPDPGIVLRATLSAVAGLVSADDV